MLGDTVPPPEEYRYSRSKGVFKYEKTHHQYVSLIGTFIQGYRSKR